MAAPSSFPNLSLCSQRDTYDASLPHRFMFRCRLISHCRVSSFHLTSARQCHALCAYFDMIRPLSLRIYQSEHHTSHGRWISFAKIVLSQQTATIIDYIGESCMAANVPTDASGAGYILGGFASMRN